MQERVTLQFYVGSEDAPLCPDPNLGQGEQLGNRLNYRCPGYEGTLNHRCTLLDTGCPIQYQMVNIGQEIYLLIVHPDIGPSPY
jgi:hypothetical protein